MVEKIKIFTEDEREIQLEAKIDTGAYSTSVDINLAKELGFGELLKKFNKIDFSKYKLKRGYGVQIEKEILEKYKNKIEGLYDVATVFSSSGSSIRPVVKIKFEMDGEMVHSKANITDRADLKYQIIIGRKNLKKFLIEI